MGNLKEMNCKHHGLTTFVERSDGRHRCKKCAVDAVVKRRRKVKELAIEYLGHKCQDCGLEDSCRGVYDFHHEEGKDFSIGEKGHCKSWNKVKAELDKCILLCANCHRRRHWDTD